MRGRIRTYPPPQPFQEKLDVDSIDVPSGHRPLNPEVVRGIADSIRRVGQLQPITVLERKTGPDGYTWTLISGRHRMEAIKQISRDITDDNGRFLNPNRSVDDYTTAEKGQVEAIVLPDGWSCNPRLIEISENLHRHELSALERDEQLAEWIRLTETSDDKPRQSDEVSKKGGRGRKGGVAEASRQLGISEPDARRAVKVADLCDEAKQTARDLGLDDNRSALLDAAKATEPSGQVEALTRRATRKSAPLAAAEARRKQKAQEAKEKAQEAKERERRNEEQADAVAKLIAKALDPGAAAEVYGYLSSSYAHEYGLRASLLINALAAALEPTAPANDGIPPASEGRV